MWAFTDHPTLFHNIKVLYWPIARLDDALIRSVETQLALFNQVREMRMLHLVEWREFLQELHSAVNVLQHGCFACLGESVRFAHDGGTNPL